jgi:hypothetical protein
MRKQSLVVLIFCVMVAVSFAAVAVFSQVSLNGPNNPNWRVFNLKPATSSLWDINKVKADPSGDLSFPIQTYLSDFATNSDASFVIYLLANDNSDITGKTFTVDANWTAGQYDTRSTTTPVPAYVRLEFQDVTSGPYDANDYWWSTGTNIENSLDMNADSSGGLTVPLTDSTRWSNLCGQRADDTNTYPDCITGVQSTVSPAEGFTNAMKKVKQVGLSFGNASRYASGVAIDGNTPGMFTVTGFTIEQ